MCNGFAKHGFQVDKSWETCFIVGRDFGMVCKQAIAIFAMESTSLVTWLVGNERCWSNTSFNGILWIVNVSDDDDRDEMRSPGCFPIIISVKY